MPESPRAVPRVRAAQHSQLLISEPPLQVLPTLAVAIGLNEALFLQQLHYWLLRSGKERDGYVWIYNTYEEWHAQLPFWSVRTIRRVVGALEEAGIVRSTTEYNQQRVDKTKWYAIDYARLEGLTETADHVANLASPIRPDWPVQEASVAASVPETTSEISQRYEEQTGENDPERFRKMTPEERLAQFEANQAQLKRMPRLS